MPVQENFIPLKASAPSVFAYAITSPGQSIVVIGNLNFRNPVNTVVTVPKLNENIMVVPINLTTTPLLGKGKFRSEMAPGEIQVLMLQGLEVK